MSQDITSFTILTSLAIITRYVGEVGELGDVWEVGEVGEVGEVRKVGGVGQEGEVGDVIRRYHHSPGSNQPSQCLRGLNEKVTQWPKSLLERFVTLKIQNQNKRPKNLVPSVAIERVHS